MHSALLSSRSGFSTLVALGITGFLLVLVTGMVTTFLTEMKITRSIYDGMVTYAGAEGAFEYAMLKIRNHREGFQDGVHNKEDPEYSMLSGAIKRTQKLAIEYTMKTQSKDYSGAIAPTTHLVIPIFVGTDTLIGKESRNPNPNTGIEISKDINFRAQSTNKLGWNIIASDKTTGRTLGLAGSGDIDPSTTGVNRQLHEDCYNTEGELKPCSEAPPGEFEKDPSLGKRWEKIQYMIEKPLSVKDFLARPELSNFYLVVFNHEGAPVQFTLKASSPFALPISQVTATAHMDGRSAQTIELTENKGRLFESIFYGMFSN